MLSLEHVVIQKLIDLQIVLDHAVEKPICLYHLLFDVIKRNILEAIVDDESVAPTHVRLIITQQ